MGVIISYTDSHLDYFARNLIVCKGDQVATVHGYVSAERITDATEEPIEVEDAKAHTNYWGDNEHDGEIAGWLIAARHKLEQDTGLALLTQVWRIWIEQFPSFRSTLYLPIWPIQSIDSFTYIDRDGAEQDLVVSPADYLLSAVGRPAQIGLLNETITWPTDARKFQPGTLTVTAGWASADLIPADLIMALKKLVGDFATFRESAMAVPGQIVQTAPMTYADLISQWILPGVA